MMTAALYTAVLVFFISVLALNVSRNRIIHRISFGDGGCMPLQMAIRAHMNALEQTLPLLPVFWILAWLQQPEWSLHGVGGLLLASRIVHAIGMLQRNFLFRRLGAMLSFLLGLVLPVWVLVAVYLGYPGTAGG